MYQQDEVSSHCLQNYLDVGPAKQKDICTVEPLYNGHHCEQHFVPYSDMSLTQGLPVYFWCHVNMATPNFEDPGVHICL